MSKIKLAAIYNVWDGVELLKGSMNQLKEEVDLFIIVWQDVSNFGEYYSPIPEMDLAGFNYILWKYIPDTISGAFNEKNKRNLGLEIAKRENCTHFLHMDCDEYYENFSEAKQKYIDSRKKGSVCKILTYFKHPTYRFDKEEGYFVPFIHILNPNTIAGVREYPLYVDPTRRINENDIGKLDVYMHHFSWVRANIERKIRNSSAKCNIEKSNLLKDYYSPDLKEGYYVKDFDNTIKVVENLFGI